jgi:probable rRNA maturation factor
VHKQAKQHQLASEEEFSYLFIHGLLHLLGYDHEQSQAEAKKMFKIQDKLFADLQDRDIVKAFKKTGRDGKKT